MVSSVEVSGIKVDFSSIRDESIKSDLFDALSIGKSADFLGRTLDGYGRNIRIEEKNVGTWDSTTINAEVLIKLNIKFTNITPVSVGSLLHHEILHQHPNVNSYSLKELQKYKEDNQEAYNELLSLVGREYAEHIVIYGFEEPAIVTLNNEYRKYVGEKANIKIPSFEEAHNRALQDALNGMGKTAEKFLFSERNFGLVLPISKGTDGNINKYLNEQGDVVSVKGSGSYNQLKFYAKESTDSAGNVTSNYGFGTSLRILGDALGFDGKFGVQGSFAKEGEGAGGKPAAPKGAVGTKPPGKGAVPGSKNSLDSGGKDDSNGKNGFGSAVSKGFESIGNAISSGLEAVGNFISSIFGKPIIFDLDGNGIQITEVTRSHIFMDAGGDGLLHRTAWAAAGNGVLFFDPDGRNAITEKRQYVFTEWDPTANSDLEAIRAIFDSNGDGKLTAADLAFAKFKLLVTNADGSMTVKTLAELGITEIDLRGDTTNITLPDGSVITGQTTFTKSDGTTGTVADTVLVAEANGHKVVQQATVDGNGNRVVTNTGYADDGSIAFVQKTVTSPNGLNVTNSFDDDGDGVYDRVQTVTTVINGNGSKTETLVNMIGANAATAITVNRTVTTTSADSKVVTTERDSTGGGWFDQREVRTKNADGSYVNVISDLAQNGTVIRSSTETVSVNGLIRSKAVDENGDGLVDATTTETITVAGNGSRTDIDAVTNRDGSLRLAQTETISADGKTKTRTDDADGNGVADVTTTDVVVVNGDGSSTSTVTVSNGNNSVRNSETHSQSADALTKTSTADVDGDGDIDTTAVDATVINGDQSRVNTYTVTNTDGYVRVMEKVTLGADKITSDTWIDQNQNGVFETTDLVKRVTVNSTTLAVTAVEWDRNPDGSVHAISTTVSSANGLSVAINDDEDADGDIDTVISDLTVLNVDGSSTQTVTTQNQDGSVRDKVETSETSDGLTVTTWMDSGGTTAWDGRSVDQRVLAVDGTLTQTVTTYAGDGTTLLSKVTAVESANKLTKTVTTDANGDTKTDHVTNIARAVNGATTVTETDYFASGAMRAETIATTSANGLSISTTINENGTLLFTRIQDTTVINANGSRVKTVAVSNNNNSARSLTITTESDDKLSTTIQSDSNADGVFERTTTKLATLNADGSVTRTDTLTSSDGQTLRRVQVTESDDKLVVTTKSDADGDGDYDLTETSTKTLLSNGGTSTTVEVRDQANALRSMVTTSVTDDERSIIKRTDTNGDGGFDVTEARSVADNGTVTTSTTNRAATGVLQSRTTTDTTANGLSSTTRFDRDGNSIYETRTEDMSVLNANGSVTETIAIKGSDGSLASSTVIVTSDDERTITTSNDRNGDGTVDLTETSTHDLSSDGVVTETMVVRAQNNATIQTATIVTSADKRSIITMRDLDGDGIVDRKITTTIADDGRISGVTEYIATDGSVEATVKTTTAGNGFDIRTGIDRDADKTEEISTVDQTGHGKDGSIGRQVYHRDGNSQLVASESYTTSDDKLLVTSRLDYNGDGLFEFQTTDQTTFAVNGDVIRSQTTRNNASAILAQITTTTSGNGLITQANSDYTGDGSIDRTMTQTALAGGGYTQVTSEFAAANVLRRTVTETLSADSRTKTTLSDVDGNGQNDRRVVVVEDLNRDRTTTFEDLLVGGGTKAKIVGFESQNGHVATYDFDFDGNGSFDFGRDTSITYLSSGARVETFTESVGATTVYSEVRTTSVNGMSSTITFDIDGDGDLDGTMSESTMLGADGSAVTTTKTLYADGTLRASAVETVFADTRHVETVDDYDGNGIADKKSIRLENSAGQIVETAISYDASGLRLSTFINTTTLDGLVTTIERNGVTQTIKRSAIDNGSYTWDNGVTAAVSKTNIVVAHVFDSLGIETWTCTKKTLNASGVLQTTVSTVRLDEDAKERLISEASRIYDAVLDRDPDFTEMEELAIYAASGQLDRSALTQALLSSTEFTTRYGTQTNAEYVTQIYLNTLGRAPSLSELDTLVRGLAAATQTKLSVALSLAESIEHHVVGNGHMQTNNFDVIMNPALFERSLDKAYLKAVVENLVDVFVDRDATAQELEQLVTRLLKGTESLEDIANVLLTTGGGPLGSIHGFTVPSLRGLTGTSLVNQAFQNALGRLPTTVERTAWEENLTSGRVTAAQFVASLALSVEHAAVGNAHANLVAATVTTLNGTTANNTLTGTAGQDLLNGLAGNDTLSGGTSGADKLVGGIGADSLVGGAQSDTYVWQRGDGADTINDSDTSPVDVDTLALSDCLATDVSLLRFQGSNDIRVAIADTNGANIVVIGQYASTSGAGLEAIVFSDGTTWTRDDIIAKTALTGGAANDTLSGTANSDNIIGGTGNDSIDGGAVGDNLTGGLGADTLKGAGGGDSYYWQKGDGADQISDIGTIFTDTDRLILSNAAVNEVTLTRSISNANLLITVTNGTSTEVITVLDRFVSPVTASGIEAIVFSDGTIWGLDKIFTETTMFGTTAADVFTGTAYSDYVTVYGGNDSINGGAGDDRLHGGDGNDTLIGGVGIDSLTGGLGNDVFVVDDVRDKTNEATAGGTDLVQSSVDWKLGVDVENLTLTGTAKTKGFGNSLANSITGNTADNHLAGGAGNDTLTGGTGNDTLVGEEGNDSLVGGLGSDFYYINSLTDVLVEAASQGIDTVSSTVSYTLAANFENLALEGNADNSATGNSAANALFGNNGANTLSGLAGNDTLKGWNGNDTLTGGTGADRFDFEGPADGVDTITDFNEVDGGVEEGDTLQFTGKVGTFSYLGTGAFTGGSDNTEARVAGNQLLMDLDGDGAVDMTITITGLTSAAQLGLSDFVFV